MCPFYGTFHHCEQSNSSTENNQLTVLLSLSITLNPYLMFKYFTDQMIHQLFSSKIVKFITLNLNSNIIVYSFIKIKF